jgi:DNA-binding phage protein
VGIRPLPSRISIATAALLRHSAERFVDFFEVFGFGEDLGAGEFFEGDVTGGHSEEIHVFAEALAFEHAALFEHSPKALVARRHGAHGDKSQEDVAQAAGVSEIYLQRIESVSTNPSYLALECVAAALGFDLDRLAISFLTSNQSRSTSGK